MDLNKIDTLVTFAFGHSNGPIKILATLVDGCVLQAFLCKDEIMRLSDRDDVLSIKMATRIKNRRKSERFSKDRRLDSL